MESSSLLRIAVIALIISCVIIGSSTFFIDASGDGLTISEDLRYGTDPFEQDTSGNGLTDYEELRVHDTNPLVEDTTGDGLADAEQVLEIGTDPSVNDTTGDGLTDVEQIDELNTDPTVNDTTEDGLADAEQVFELGIDPAVNDTTGDSLSDAEQVHNLSTNPAVNDTTGDGLSDAEQVFELGTDPAANYTTENGLSDIEEIEIGTDPTMNDTSGDGLPDGYAYEEGELDPLRKNVVVEINYEEGVELPEELDDVVDVFDEAPVESDVGEPGINLVLIDDGTVDELSTTDFETYAHETYQDDFNRQGDGVYHALFVEDLEQGEDTIGVTRADTDGMLVDDWEDDATAATFMHELGHQMGLWLDVHDGIDSTEYTWGEYPSIMNYNRPVDCSATECVVEYPLEFDDGTGHDDWGYIEENYDENHPDTSEIAP